MEFILQGEARLDFFCMTKEETEESAVLKFIKLLDMDYLKIREITVEGSDGRLHKLGIEGSEMEINSIIEVDEDTPKKYLDYQVGGLVVSESTGI
ncbi:hypothetical protein [Metabacillus sp. Hm71]|uniref:hypothetical protein n=1 Tax=Metabacillus sp. Hm71 TaxID=3450743 RepID=UPI003F429AA3